MAATACPTTAAVLSPGGGANPLNGGGADPPVAPQARATNEALIDEYTAKGNAKKVRSAIASAAKFAGLDRGTTKFADTLPAEGKLDGDKAKAGAAAQKFTTEQGDLTRSKIAASMAAPEELVKDAGSWKVVKERYLEDPRMRLLLQYRVHEVGRIYKQVIDEMWAADAPKRKANKDALAAKIETPYAEDTLFQLNDLQFAMMGSTDLTSDYTSASTTSSPSRGSA